MIEWIVRNYRYYFEECADSRVETWPLLTSPFQVTLILILYHRFVYKIGPAFMKNREPFNLNKVIQLFNIVQILACSYIVIAGTPIFPTLDIRCSEVDYTSNGLSLIKLGYVYFSLKVLDLFDTIFFVLRKKTNQITFLHVYHHILMVIIGYITIKYQAGGHSYYLPYFNSMIHAVMYFYYFVSSYSTSTNTIWWKKYITQMQLVQFVILIVVYLQPAIRPECGYSKIISWLCISQSVLMLVLFGKFYYKAYIKVKK